MHQLVLIVAEFVGVPHRFHLGNIVLILLILFLFLIVLLFVLFRLLILCFHIAKGLKLYSLLVVLDTERRRLLTIVSHHMARHCFVH